MDRQTYGGSSKCGRPQHNDGRDHIQHDSRFCSADNPDLPRTLRLSVNFWEADLILDSQHSSPLLESLRLSPRYHMTRHSHYYGDKLSHLAPPPELNWCHLSCGIRS